MGFVYRKTVPLNHGVRVNISKSGVSASARSGRVTLNTRGTGRIRVARGLSFRFKL